MEGDGGTVHQMLTALVEAWALSSGFNEPYSRWEVKGTSPTYLQISFSTSALPS
jgi:hypothetical protein